MVENVLHIRILKRGRSRWVQICQRLLYCFMIVMSFNCLCVCRGPVVLVRVELGVLSRGQLGPAEIISLYIQENTMDKVPSPAIYAYIRTVYHTDLVCQLGLNYVTAWALWSQSCNQERCIGQQSVVSSVLAKGNLCNTVLFMWKPWCSRGCDFAIHTLIRCFDKQIHRNESNIHYTEKKFLLNCLCLHIWPFNFVCYVGC